MPRRHHPTAEFPEHLEALYERFPFERSLAQDPLSCVRPFAGNPRAAEVAGIFAATLAIGTTTSIRGAFARFAAAAGDDLPAFVEGAARPANARQFEGFKHRWIRGDQLHYLSLQLREIYRTSGSLEQVFLNGSAEGGGEFSHGLDALSRALREPAGPNGPPPPGYARLFPSPLDSGSPCKRLVLYVRWMVRTEYPDLGVWRRVPPSVLRIPLDFHVFWIAYHLGLTQRRTRSWAAVEEITDALRRIDPTDPIKFDFVLCHTGISGDCPKERDESVCGPCVVRTDSRLWHRVKWREAIAA
ncbi:MAG: DUF2400 domain-containing protein [Thermoplasmata archaeon]|nr:DUF2400 domain-containing protein [Thermoplasmata archaeon]